MKFLIKKPTVISFVFVYIVSAHAIVDPDWCGNKHKNLVILDDILKNDPHAQVPAFLGIPTGRVEQFLRDNDSDIFDLYTFFIENVHAKKRSLFSIPFVVLKKIFQRNRSQRYHNYSQEELLERIQLYIKRCFQKEFPFTQEELNFFQTLKQEGKFLMVRSTGVEDNPNAANAGGNVSVAYISPEKEAIQKAMGDVVASYFGMQSLKNRIAGGEVLSATDITVPVLIQELIGEPLDGATDSKDIPISGVAYTTNQSLSGQHFALTEINAAYGHGEGVVANKVTADRYYLKSSRVSPAQITIYPMLHEKRERLIPYKVNTYPETVGLKALKNNYSLAHKTALSQEQLRALYNTLKHIEVSYKQPMDVEFVIMEEKIYIVQARPAMHKPANPSYFTTQNDNHTFEKIPSFTIVPGLGAALIITNPKDIIVTRTLDEADQMPNSAQVKAVIVAQWASSLSHPAVNFMSHGTPCMFVQNQTTVDNWLKKISARHPLIIDIQQGFVGYWYDTKQKAETCIKQGWFEHPIERTASLFLDDAEVLSAETPHIPKDPVIMNLMQTLKVIYDPLKRKELLDQINKRVETIINLTEKRVANTNYDLGIRTQSALQEFKKTYKSLTLEFSAAIDQHVEHFEFLFYHKMLEALLYQVHEQQRILADYTYAYFLNEIYAKQYIQKIISQNKSSHAHELQYTRYCPQELAEKWINTVLMIDELQINSSNFGRDSALFFDFLHELEESHNIALWFATVFYQHLGNADFTQEAVKNLISSVAHDYTPDNKHFWETLKEFQNTVLLIKPQMNKGFSTLSQAESRWNDITKLLIDPLTASFFVSSFASASFFLKIVACSIMKDCIDIVDGTIKELKTSTDILMNERIAYFKTMLNGFNTLFKVWIEEIMPEDAIPYNSSWPLQQYCEKMESLYQEIIYGKVGQLQKIYDIITLKKYFTSIFQKSEKFSVNAAMIGTQTDFERHFPASAEDIFMLIHQNSLVAVAATMTSLFSGQSLDTILYIPPFLNACREMIANNQGRRIIPIGIDYSSNLITLSYNIPLNNHSGACQLTYNTITQECSCAVQFLGQARTRWASIDLIARLSPQLSGLSFLQEVHFDAAAGIVEWSWNIAKTDQMPIVLEYINYMSDVSMSYDIEIERLYPLYKGTGDAEEEVRKIVRQEGSRLARSVLK